MSELKERMLGQTISSYGCDTRIYLKADADKVIAHNKFKRCLAMADYCSYKAWYYKYNGKEDKFYRWMKFRRVWAELAKKFKEAK